MNSLLSNRIWCASLAAGWLAFAPTSLRATDAIAWVLRTNVLVGSEGVFLDDVAVSASDAPLPNFRLADAPPFGQALALTRAQVGEALARTGMMAATNWSGAARVSITRRSRMLGEFDLLALVRTTLQKQYVKNRGELELRLTRPWTTIRVPDEPLTLRVLDMPGSGVTSYFILRFELLAGSAPLGTWQAPLQARVWQEVLVARQAVRRSDLLADGDFASERRDQLTTREAVSEFPAGQGAWELTENLQAGQPLTPRSLRLRPVVRRGQTAEAVLQDGALNISLKVEILEEGAPGQIVRARNPQSRREVRGKVINEKTLLLML